MLRWRAALLAALAASSSIIAGDAHGLVLTLVAAVAALLSGGAAYAALPSKKIEMLSKGTFARRRRSALVP